VGHGRLAAVPVPAEDRPGGRRALRERVAAELKTTFASHYTAEISLQEALQPDVVTAFDRRATGRSPDQPGQGLSPAEADSTKNVQEGNTRCSTSAWAATVYVSKICMGTMTFGSSADENGAPDPRPIPRGGHQLLRHG
jgi:hypothetical protein